MLLKIYLGLIATAVVLCGIWLERHLAGGLSFGGSGPTVIAAQRDPPPNRNYAPTINWGGAKR